jgi:hypothetical protein
MEPISMMVATKEMALPFILAVGQDKTVNKTRIFEALIIGGVIAAVGKFFALPVLIEQIETVNKNIAKLEHRISVVEDRIEARRTMTDDHLDRLKREISEIKIEHVKRAK